MHRLLVRSLGLFTCFVCAGCVDTEPSEEVATAAAPDAAAPDAAAPALDQAQARAVSTALELLTAAGTAAGFSVAIWRDGEVIYAEGVGVSNARGEPVTPRTLFQIGSDTKKLTAITALQSVARGELELDATLHAQLPDFDFFRAPGVTSAVTVHDLLTHHSGLFGYTPWFDSPDDATLHEIAYGQFLANEFSLLPPRVAWAYCNANFSLLGLLVEHVTSRAWPDVVSQDVFAPLGLSHTYARRDEMLQHEADIASGFGLASLGDPFAQPTSKQPAPHWVEPAEQIDNAFLRPAGLVWSTASDQARLLGFLARGNAQVLSDEYLEQLATGHVPMHNHDRVGAYGYGVSVQTGWLSEVTAAEADAGLIQEQNAQSYVEAKLVGHGGQTLNMTSLSLLLPEQQVAVVILANSADAQLTSAGFELLQIVAGNRLPAPTSPPKTEPPNEDLEPYAGDYMDATLGPVSIRVGSAGLELTIAALTDAGVSVEPLLRPIARDLFIATVDGEQYPLSFYDGPDGEPNRYAVSPSESIVLVRQ